MSRRGSTTERKRFVDTEREQAERRFSIFSMFRASGSSEEAFEPYDRAAEKKHFTDTDMRIRRRRFSDALQQAEGANRGLAMPGREQRAGMRSDELDQLRLSMQPREEAAAAARDLRFGEKEDVDTLEMRATRAGRHLSYEEMLEAEPWAEPSLGRFDERYDSWAAGEEPNMTWEEQDAAHDARRPKEKRPNFTSAMTA